MKKITAIVLSLVMVIGLAACGSTATPAETTPGTAAAETTEDAQQAIETQTNIDTEAGKSDYIAPKVSVIGNQSSTLYPWGKSMGENALFNVYEYLFNFVDYGGEVKAFLADSTKGEFEGYDHEAGTGDYTVYIYDYIKDSEGNPVTANDVKWSFETNNSLEQLSGTAWKEFQGIDVKDDTTVVFHFNKEINSLGDLDDFWTSTPIIAQAAYEKSESAFNTEAIGTGPYKVKEYVPGSQVTLVKNENYWQTNDELKQQAQHQNVEEIVYVVNQESAQQLIALESGIVDVVENVNTSDLKDFQDGGMYADDFDIFTYPQTGITFAACNCSESSICSDVNMRKAILYAIDVEGLCQAMGADNVVRAYGLYGTLQPDFLEKWKTDENYQTVTDQKLVDEYLQKAGYNGETVKLITDSGEKDTAQVVLNMLTNAGITAELSVLDKTTSKSVEEDPAAWDVNINKYSAPLGAVAVTRSFSVNKGTGMTNQFINDPEWSDLMATCLTIDGHNEENIDAWMQMTFDKAYAIGLFSKNNNIVYRSNIKSLCRNGKNKFIPGGFIYVDPEA